MQIVSKLGVVREGVIVSCIAGGTGVSAGGSDSFPPVKFNLQAVETNKNVTNTTINFCRTRFITRMVNLPYASRSPDR